MSDDRNICSPQSRRLKFRFLVILTALTAAASVCLGVVINAHVGQTMVRSVSNVTAYHMEIFLQPLLQGSRGTGVLAPDVATSLDQMLVAASPGRRLEQLRIWRLDGTIAYSTDKTEVGTRQPNPELEKAFAGQDVAYFGKLSDHGNIMQKGIGKPLLEAYFPLRTEGSDGVIAVGEFYEDATELRNRIDAIRMQTWTVIALASTITMLLLMVAAERTSAGLRAIREELARRLHHEQELARQNAELRGIAEQARLSAIVTNENLLAKIGSDIHDGPIQLLTLLVMKLTSRVRSGGEKRERDPEEIALANQVLLELRDIAQGLVLPELEGRNAEAAIMLAVDKHENLTGTNVHTAIDKLPDGLANAQITCLYRVVQECLSNSFRHAEGKAQCVRAQLDDGCIEVRVSDGGPGFSLASSKQHIGLGMAGLTKRLEALGGSLTIRSGTEKGATVIARLPL